MPKFQLHPVRASAIILILFSLGFSIYSFANAWVEPGTTPPGGNIAAPLHTGTTSQTKQGFLTAYGVEGYYPGNGAYGALGYFGWGGYFNGGVYTNSSLIAMGSVGIGTASPAARLDVYGDIMSNGSNMWMFHTPDDGRTTLYFGRGSNGSIADWPIQFSAGGDIYSSAAGVWMSQLCRADGTNCPSTSGLYLPLAGGVMNAGSRVGFNGGTSYGIGQGAASPNLNSIAVDTLETNGGVGGGGTLELNYYGGNAVTIGPGGTKPLYAAIMYDGNNSGYYVDPSGSSRLNQIYYADSAYVVDLRPQYMYDWNDTNYYMDFNNVSSLNDLRVNILYDRQNTGYYVDPNGNTRLNNSYTGGFLTSWPGYSGFVGYYGNYIFPGWNDSASWNQSYFIYGNSGNSGLRTNGNWLVDGNIYCASCGGWLSTLFNGVLRLNTWQGNHYSGSDGAEYATIFYDTNNSGYYVDPGGSSRLNQIYYADSAYVVDLRPQYMYDWNDTNYYMDFNNTSRVNYLGRNYGWNWTEYDWNDTNYYMDLNNTSKLNYLVTNNSYAYGWMQAQIFYDANDNGYYVDPNGNSVFNYAEIKNSSEPTINFHRPGIFATGIKLRSDNRLWFGGWSAGEGAAEIVTGRMLDGNNTGYYVDPNGSSRMNQLYYVDSAYVVDLRPQYMYDWNDTNYYMDFNNVSSLNDLRVNILYDRQNTGFYVDPASTTVLNVVYANQYNCMSDLELKKDIKPIGNALDKVLSIKGVSFTWKDEEMGTGNQVGVIAQDVEKVLPEIVSKNSEGYEAVDYTKLSPLIIEAIKELKSSNDSEINGLKQIINNLESRDKEKDNQINDLRRRLEILELR